MRLYNSNTSKIEEVGAILETLDGIMYVDKLSETQLNELGYFRVEYGVLPNRRYYSSEEVGVVVGDKYVISYNAIDKPLADTKELLLKSLHDRKEEILASRPHVDTTLGFFVDGGYRDIINLRGLKDIGATFCIDIDGNPHPIANQSDWDIIINKVTTHGLGVYEINKNMSRRRSRSRRACPAQRAGRAGWCGQPRSSGRRACFPVPRSAPSPRGG